MVLAYRQETREYMNFGVPSVCLTLAVKKVAWLSWRHCIILVFLISLELQVRTGSIWRQDADTIHDHNHTPKISTQVQQQSAIMGRNGRGIYFQMMLFFPQGLQFITHLLYYCATFSSAVVGGQSSQMSTKAGFFPIFRCLELELRFQINFGHACHAVMIQLT